MFTPGPLLGDPLLKKFPKILIFLAFEANSALSFQDGLFSRVLAHYALPQNCTFFSDFNPLCTNIISILNNTLIDVVTGGLFDMTDTVQEIAFRYAVDRVNVRSDILPRSRLTAQIERIPQQDSFYASKQGKYTVSQKF